MQQDVRVFIVRTTNACNLACSYCYMPDKGETRMPAELAARLIDAAATLPATSQVFVWHGGQPLLMGCSSRPSSSASACTGSIMSTPSRPMGYGLPDAMVDFFAERDFRLAVTDIPAARDAPAGGARPAGRPSSRSPPVSTAAPARSGRGGALAVVADLERRRRTMSPSSSAAWPRQPRAQSRIRLGARPRRGGGRALRRAPVGAVSPRLRQSAPVRPARGGRWRSNICSAVPPACAGTARPLRR